jgi:hypothetical protein
MTKLEPIAECDALRTPDNACLPDERSASFVVVNRRTGETHPRSLADEHAELQRLVLSDAVPQAVRIQFETAKNLLLYSWFCYRFMQVAELHALGTVEMALRRRLGIPDDADDAPGLGFLLRRALEEGWLRDEGLRHVERLMTTRPEPIRAAWVDHEGVHLGDLIVPEVPVVSGYAKMLATELPWLRNKLAHGSEMLDYPYLILELSCDIIDQLFRPVASEEQ